MASQWSLTFTRQLDVLGRLAARPPARWWSNTSAGGIMLTDGAVERPSTATVVAAGPGKKGEDGELVPMNIKKGDKVMFFKYAGDKMYDDNGVEYIVVRENDILATM